MSSTFAYDDQDRLTSVTLAATGATAETHYDPLGNITSKTGVGAYAYDDAAHPHQLTRITRPDGEVERYAYDPSGDEIARPGSRDIDYTSFHLPSRMRTRDADVRFTYDADGARVQKSSDAETIVYVAGLYERIETRDRGRRDVEHRVYVPGPGRNVAILKFHADGRETKARETLFVHQDHLGSLDALSLPSGRVVERHSYDAFGAPRDPDWTKQGPAPRSPDGSTIGFTAQEDDPELGLVNMRGRLYDPRRGRFLSADPRTPSALSIGWNRYAYANDNPLRFVDPSGFDAQDGGEYDGDTYSSGNPAETRTEGGIMYLPPDSFTEKKSAPASSADDAATATASGADAGDAKTDGYSRAPATAVSGNASRSDGATTTKPPTTPPRATPEEHWSAGKAGMLAGAIEMGVSTGTAAFGPLLSGPARWAIGATLLPRIEPSIPSGDLATDYQAGMRVTATVALALGIAAPMILDGVVAGAAAGADGAFLSRSTGPAFDAAKLARIQTNLEGQGVTFVTGPDGDAMLRGLGGEAAYLAMEGGRPGVVVLGSNPSRAAVVEELLHLGQHRATGWSASFGSQVTSFEIQAQTRLLGIGARLGWSEAELNGIKTALQSWMGK